MHYPKDLTYCLLRNRPVDMKRQKWKGKKNDKGKLERKGRGGGELM